MAYIDTVMDFFIPRIYAKVYTNVGLEEHAVVVNKVYPNPVNDKLYFESNEDYTVEAINVISINGQKIRTINVTDGQNSVDLSSLNKGVYMLEFISGSESSVQKIVKQ